MTNIFNLENIDNFSEKINIDELYESKKNHDLNKLALYQKILNRVHVRIKTTSKQKKHEPFCWYVIPEIIIGVPKYDQSGCIAYIINKLEENGFNVRYFHPNTILICWNNLVPTYIRNEFKKKTGIVINEFGKKMEESNNSIGNLNEIVLNSKENLKSEKTFTPIQSYKPLGNLIYNNNK